MSSDPHHAKFDEHRDRVDPSAMPLPDQDRLFANWLQNAPDRKGLFRVAERRLDLARLVLQWRKGIAWTPLIRLMSAKDGDIELAKHSSLVRFAKPIDELLTEVHARQGGAYTLPTVPASREFV